MHLGLIGLGKMGGNMRERIRRAGHEVVGFDRNPEVSDVDSLKAMVEALPAPRTVWVMVPAGEATRATVAELGEFLDEGDLVIDGGNSRFTDDAVNAETLADKGIGYLDCGVSGGVWGLENGYGLMVGGDAEHSGERRWTVEEGIANAVPMPVISAALFARFASRQDDSPAMKAVSALRNQFGGHATRAADAGPSSGSGSTD